MHLDMNDCDPETKAYVVSLGFVVLTVTACTILTWEMHWPWTIVSDESRAEAPGVSEAEADAEQLDRA